MHDSSQSSRRGQSDVFRPRLPLDPFSPAPSPRAPDTTRVLVDPDAPWPATDLQLLAQAFAGAPHVVLVLGSPAPHLLAPLLRSHTFARCLLLLVTHAPPPLTALRSAAAPLPLPQTRILRLRTPLDPAAPAFALELVSVLDAAANVAREWRVAPDDDDVVQLAQGVDGAAFVVREVMPSSPGEVLPTSEHRHPPAPRRSLLGPSPPSYPANRTRPPSSLSLVSTASAPSRSFFSRRGSDASSASNASTSRPTRNRRDSASSAFSAKSSSSTLSKSSPKRDSRRESTLTAQTRPFDALLSFLPPAQPEKAVLKQVVLVTTLATVFLAGAGPRSVGMVACACAEWLVSGLGLDLGVMPSPSPAIWLASHSVGLASHSAGLASLKKSEWLDILSMFWSKTMQAWWLVQLHGILKNCCRLEADHSNPRLSAIFEAAIPQVAEILAAWDNAHPVIAKFERRRKAGDWMSTLRSLVPTPELEVVLAPPLATLMEHRLLAELVDDERNARALGVGSALLQLLAVQIELEEPLNLNGDLISDLRDRTVVPCPTDGDKALEAMFVAAPGVNSSNLAAWLKKMLRFKKAHTIFDQEFCPPTFRREYPPQSAPTLAIPVALNEVQAEKTAEQRALKRKHTTQGLEKRAKKLKSDADNSRDKSKHKADGQLDDERPGKKAKVKRGEKESTVAPPPGRQPRKL
ncbi:hypothetical protein C8R43DRAFT_956965 [Mycena crocata]|nr:hypothetical protein C8R43DRAFT_956965 [Mycena crocata]